MNVKERKLTQERLKELLDYNPDTGVFTKKKNINNGRGKEGDVVGSITEHGYLSTQIDKKRYYCHRLAWLYMRGHLPKSNIDHINRIKTDNRILNLRGVSQQCNARNSGLRYNNTSSVKGIYWHKPRKKWCVRIFIDSKTKHVGIFEDFKEAVCARLAVEQCLGWNGCDSSSTAYQFVRKMLKKQGESQ